MIEGISFDIGLTLGIIVLAVVLFATEKLRADVIAVMVLLTLVFTGLIDERQAFAGFASPAVITVWAVYIVSAGLFKTGVADFLGERILRLAGSSEPRLIAVLMLTCGGMSAFMNNIGAAAVLLPAVIQIARQTGIPASRLLIPLAFSSLLGGNMTLIGTPPNILAVEVLASRGYEPFGFFDYAPTGVIVFATGVLFMTTVGRFFLPNRRSAEHPEASFDIRRYVSEVRVLPDGPLVGRTLRETRLGADQDILIVGIERDGEVQMAPPADTMIHEGDLMLVEAPVDKLLAARQRLGLTVELEGSLELPGRAPSETVLFEAVLSNQSPLIGRSVAEASFRDRYGFSVLALRRDGAITRQLLRNVRLLFGDTLLLSGPRSRLADLRADRHFFVLEPVRVEERRLKKAPLAVGIIGFLLFLATFAKVGIAVAMVSAALLMVLTRCLTMDEAYQSIEWRSVFLIAAMLPLGTAMESTGTAAYLAQGVVETLGGIGPIAVLAGLYVLSALLTQPMSNAATTLLIAPIAIDVAVALGADPHPFVLTVVIACSTAFLTPVGHQSNVLVFGPGGYRFFDFTRVGAPLSLAIMVVTLLTLPLIWPLYPTP